MKMILPKKWLNCRKAFALLTVLTLGGVLVAPADAKTFYVRANGKDTNAGTANTALGAWKTIERACQTAANGDVIAVADGTYSISQTAILRPGVTLKGNSRANTILKGGSTIPEVGGLKTMIQIVTPPKGAVYGKTTIKSLTFDGSHIDNRDSLKRYTRAIGADKVNHIEVADVKLKTFRGGMEFASCSYVDVHDFVGFNASSGFAVVYSGAVNNSKITHFHCWNGTVTGDATVAPGQAVGAGGWNTDNSPVNGHSDDIQIWNITHNVSGSYTDSGGNAAAFSMEMQGGAVSNVRIHHCNLNGTISFPIKDDKGGMVEFDHNTWSNVRIYALETYGTSYIHDNTFGGGHNAIAGFGDGEDARIEGNTFIGQDGIGYAPILIFGPGLKNATFTGNHVYMTSGSDWFALFGAIANVSVANNDFHTADSGSTGRTNFQNLITTTPGITQSGNTYDSIFALRINSAGNAAGSFIADQNVIGGNTATYSNTISASGVASPAPSAVYNSERWGASTYTVPGFTAGGSYTVRLHFCENWFGTGNPGGGGNGSRRFNVAINGTIVLSNFDILATVGATRKAVVRQFTATANSNGELIIAFTAGAADNPLINGIEIIK